MGLMFRKVLLFYGFLSFDCCPACENDLCIFTTKHILRALLPVLLLDQYNPKYWFKGFSYYKKKGNKDMEIYARYANREEVKSVGEL